MKKTRNQLFLFRLLFAACLLVLLAGFRARRTAAQLAALDTRVRQEFTFARLAAADALSEHTCSPALSQAVTKLQMTALYGYDTDGRGGGDPQWLILAEALQEVSNPDIFRCLSDADCGAIAQFFSTHDYRNSPPIAAEDLAPLLEPLQTAVNLYLSE